MGEMLSLDIPDELVERIARRAADIVAEREQKAPSAPQWLDTAGAAEHLACSKGRIHDLVQLRKLRPRRDGRRLLFKREELDAYVENDARPRSRGRR